MAELYVRDGNTGELVKLSGVSLTIGEIHDEVGISYIDLPTNVYNGQTTVPTAGSGVPLDPLGQEINHGVIIKALSGNADKVYLGDGNVSAITGFVLAAGEEALIKISDLDSVYIDANSDGDGVSYIAS